MERPLSVGIISLHLIERNGCSSAHSALPNMSACSENGKVPPMHKRYTVAYSMPWKEMMASQLWGPSRNIRKEQPVLSPK